MAARRTAGETGASLAAWRRTMAVATLVVCLAAPFLPPVHTLDRLIGDPLIQLARDLSPEPAPDPDVALIGIDEATYAAFPEPFALWHRHLGTALGALADADAGMTGIDIVLPDRSFNAILPGSDVALMRGLVRKRRAGGVALGLTVDGSGIVRPIHGPFLAASGHDGQAAVLLPVDPDQVIRRYTTSVGSANLGAPKSDGAAAPRERLPTLVGALATGQAGQLDQVPAGGINYSIGPALSYVSLAEVVRRAEDGDTAWLRTRFAGRPVLIGTVLPFEDRMRQPVPLTAWEPDNRQVPGVVVHAQALRTALAGTPVSDLPPWLVAALCAAMGAGWWLGKRAWLAPVALVIGAAWLAAATAALGVGLRLPVAAPLVALAVAVGLSLLTEAAIEAAERRRLRKMFGGFVGDDVLEELLKDRGTADVAGVRRTLCVLVSDIRDFTQRAETVPPPEIVALLNRYFSEMVDCVLSNRGTVDKFMGDGLLAFFGAPHASDNPAADGFAAAQEMVRRLETLNAELVAEGIPPLRIGIGLAYGEAVVGTVGGQDRHEYTAIGDAVNLAARVEPLTKSLGGPVLMTEAVRARLGPVVPPPQDVGIVDIRGRQSEQLARWAPDLSEEAGQTATGSTRRSIIDESESAPCPQ